LNVADHLVAKEIEVDPLLRAAPLRATEKLAVKLPGRGKIVDRDREVEGSEFRNGHRERRKDGEY
jgi:hypothetical protein